MDGFPVENADIRAVLVDDLLAARVAKGYPPARDILAQMQHYRTNAEGLAEIPSPDKLLAVAIRAEKTQVNGVYFDPEAEGEVELELLPEFVVNGTVRFADGRPASGVLIEGSVDLYHRRLSWFPGHPLHLSTLALWLFGSDARTNDQGEFSIGQLSLGPATLRASLEGYSTALDPSIDLPHGDPVHFILYRGTPVGGMVVDATTLDPIVGALVRAATPRANLYPDVYYDQTHTLSDGSFELPSIPTDRGNTSLVVSQDGYASAIEHLGDAGTGRSRLQIELEPAKPILGSVVNARDGAPILSASLTFLSQPNLLHVDRVLSMADGSFSSESLSETSAYSIAVYHPGYQDQTLRSVTPSDDPVSIRLQPLSRIDGTVTANNNPVGPGRVRLVKTSSTDRISMDRWIEFDEKGKFSFLAVTPGNYSIQALADHYALTTISPVYVSPAIEAPTVVTLDLEAGASVWGLVVYQDTGAPIAGATVRLADLTGSDALPSATPVKAITDEDGHYEIGQVPYEERVAIVAEHDGLATSLTPILVPSSQGSLQLNMQLESPASIDLRIIQPDGTPLLRFDARAYWPGKPSHVIHVNDGVGQMLALSPGKWSIEAFATRDAVASNLFDGGGFVREVTLASGETSQVVFSAAESGTVHGTIGGNTALVRNRSLVALAKAAGNSLSYNNYTRTVIGDEFWIHGLKPGTHYVWVQSVDQGDQISAGAEINISTAEVTELTLTLGESSISGRVADANGEPIPHARMLFVRTNDHPVPSTSPSARIGRCTADSGIDGTYRAIGLLPESYLVRITAENFATHEERFTIQPSDHQPTRDFQLQPEATLEATVLSPSGTRIPDASVELRSVTDPNRNTIRSSAADADAVFRFEQLAGERYEVIAKSGALFPAIAVVDLVAGANHTVTLQLRDRGDLAVRVASIEGPAVPNAPVILRDSYGATSADWRQRGWIEIGDEGLMTDNMGACLIRGVPAGKLSIEAMFTTMMVTVEPAETTKAYVTSLE